MVNNPEQINQLKTERENEPLRSDNNPEKKEVSGEAEKARSRESQKQSKIEKAKKN